MHPRPHQTKRASKQNDRHSLQHQSPEVERQSSFSTSSQPGPHGTFVSSRPSSSSSTASERNHAAAQQATAPRLQPLDPSTIGQGQGQGSGRRTLMPSASAPVLSAQPASAINDLRQSPRGGRLQPLQSAGSSSPGRSRLTSNAPISMSMSPASPHAHATRTPTIASKSSAAAPLFLVQPSNKLASEKRSTSTTEESADSMMMTPVKRGKQLRDEIRHTMREEEIVVPASSTLRSPVTTTSTAVRTRSPRLAVLPSSSSSSSSSSSVTSAGSPGPSVSHSSFGAPFTSVPRLLPPPHRPTPVKLLISNTQPTTQASNTNANTNANANAAKK